MSKESSGTNRKSRSDERSWNEKRCRNKEGSKTQEFRMTVEKTRTQNKNWFDTDKVPRIKEEVNDDIVVSRPAHEAAAAKLVVKIW